jgi:hypothetical protein
MTLEEIASSQPLREWYEELRASGLSEEDAVQEIARNAR